MRAVIALALGGLPFVGAAPAVAQDTLNLPLGQLQPGSVISAILTVDPERLFNGSAFGQRVAREHTGRLEQLAAENRSREAELAAEEEQLTQKRGEMEPEAFRQLADAFDAKVRQTEAEQLAKESNLGKLLDQERAVFLAAAQPILQQLMQESGAAVILERRFVFLGVAEVDITDRAIELLDETLGSGSAPD